MASRERSPEDNSPSGESDIEGSRPNKRRRTNGDHNSSPETQSGDEDDVERTSPEDNADLVDLDDFNSEDGELDEAESQHILDALQAEKPNLPAEYGIIEEILCINFMCHTKLRVKLGPLINFIIGHNGSGKSAVLTALSLCLGAKTQSTNRGSTLKKFIKQGEDQAMLSVKIKNQGEMAYQPDVYGDSIIVERHFTSSGSASFKLKSATERLITTKRADLEDMLDYLALQLDNPMNVLTQDMARQFLNSSSSKDKYKFFMKGTQLEQLDRDYNIMGEAIDSTEDKLESRKADIAGLKAKVQEAEQRKRIIDEAETIQARVQELSSMHVWCQVEEQERQLAALIRAVVDVDAELAQAEEKAETQSGQYDRLNQVHETATAALVELRQSDVEVAARHAAVKEKFDANKKHLVTCTAERRRIMDDLKQTNTEIKRHEESISNEETRIAAENGPAQAQRLADLAQANQAKEDRIAELDALDRRPLESAKVAAEAKADQLRRTAEQARGNWEGARDQLKNLTSPDGDLLAPYHPKMGGVLRMIDNERNFREKPVGPIGTKMRLKKPMWSSILEQTFGGVLDGFVVTCEEDRRLLAEILRRAGLHSATIYKQRQGRIDVSRNEPDPTLDTILRVLEIEDDMVRNLIIVQQAAEQIVLIEDNEAAFNFSENENHRNYNTRATLAMSAQPGKGIRFDKGRGSGPIHKWKGKTRIRTDRDAQIRQQQAIIDRLGDERSAAERAWQEARTAFTQAAQALKRFDNDQNKYREAVQRAEDKIEDLQNRIEADKIDAGQLDVYKEQLKEAREAEAQHSASYQDAINEKDRLNVLQTPIKEELDAVTREMEECEAKIKKADTRATQTAEGRHKALVEKNKAIDAIGRAKQSKTEIEARRDAQQTHTDDLAREASEHYDRVAVEEGLTIEIIDARLARIKRDHQNAESRAGGNREQIYQAWQAIRAQHDEAEREYNGSRDAVIALKHARHTRQQRWKWFRRYIMARAKVTFTYLLSERAFRGHILVDHKDGKLDISVEPDMARNSDKGRQTKTLSGGEKSFSTICLLLSIWEAMGSPIRCLDEFDVFMDNVNRDISMRMMIQAANRAVSRQFILITPQAMGTIRADNNVKIHKMSDPERGQTALPFNA